jgi:hypothetical protein
VDLCTVLPHTASDSANPLVMDDIFEGYMEMHDLADFLVESGPAPKQAERIEQCYTPSSENVKRSPTFDGNGDQW